MTAGPRCLACASRELDYWATAHDVEYKTVPESFTYYRCRRCEALSIDPVPDDRLGEIYPPNYYSFTAARRSVVDRVKETIDRRRFRKTFSRLSGAELSALDVGGGSGHQLDVLRAADSRVTRTTIVDMDEGAEARARAAGHRFVRGRIEDVEMDDRFHIVLLLNLIEHVADPRAVLRKVRELLSPDGVALIQTPNYVSLDARLFRAHDWGGFHCPRHWVIFTASSFERILAAAGLQVRTWRYTQGAAFWTISVLAALDRRGLVRIGRERPAWFHPLFPALAGGFAAVDFARGLASPLSQMVFVVERSA